MAYTHSAPALPHAPAMSSGGPLPSLPTPLFPTASARLRSLPLDGAAPCRPSPTLRSLPSSPHPLAGGETSRVASATATAFPGSTQPSYGSPYAEKAALRSAQRVTRPPLHFSLPRLHRAPHRLFAQNSAILPLGIACSSLVPGF